MTCREEEHKLCSCGPLPPCDCSRDGQSGNTPIARQLKAGVLMRSVRWPLRGTVTPDQWRVDCGAMPGFGESRASDLVRLGKGQDCLESLRGHTASDGTPAPDSTSESEETSVLDA